MMRQIVEIMKDRAHFVAGKDPWFRAEHDAAVKLSLSNAEIFLAHVGPSMGTPEITGGTTSDPDNVLTLYWLANTDERINGVYVRFNADGTCDVAWDIPPIFADRIEHLSIRELLALNVPAKLKQLRRGTGKDNAPPSIER